MAISRRLPTYAIAALLLRVADEGPTDHPAAVVSALSVPNVADLV
jgi:hypothetical protein